MSLSRFRTPGIAVGVLTLLAAIASAAGYPLAATVFTDPAVVDAVTKILIGGGAGLAGVLAGAGHKAE